MSQVYPPQVSRSTISDPLPGNARPTQPVADFPGLASDLARSAAQLRLIDDIIPHLRLERTWNSTEGRPEFWGRCPSCGAHFTAYLSPVGITMGCWSRCTVDELKAGLDRFLHFQRQADALASLDDRSMVLHVALLENAAVRGQTYARVNVERRQRQLQPT